MATTTETTTAERVHVPELVDPEEHVPAALAPRDSTRSPQEPSPAARPVSEAVPVQRPKDDLAAMRSVEIDQLALALAHAQGEFDALVKNQSASIDTKREGAKGFTYAYADLAAVLDVVRPVLAKEKIAVIQLPNSQGGYATVSTMLVHGPSGQFIRNNLTCRLAGEDPKALGSALTYLRRYALQSIAGVAPEEDDDGAAAGGERPPDPPRPAERRSAQRSAGGQTTQRESVQSATGGDGPKKAETGRSGSPEPATAANDRPATDRSATAPAPAVAALAETRTFGFIERIEDKGTTAVMVFFSDSPLLPQASCSVANRKDVVDDLRNFHKRGDRVEVTTVPSSDPKLYPPRIVAARAVISNRDPGQEG